MSKTAKIFLTLLFLALAAYGQQKEKVAIINTVDDGNPPLKPLELGYLTDKLREIAGNVLPDKNYDVVTEEYITDFSGSQEEAEKKCEEASGCLAKLGRDIKVHYIAQGRIGRFGSDLTIKVELYNTKSSKLVSSLVGKSKDINGLLSELEKKTPDMFKKMSGVTDGSKAVSTVASGISGVESVGGSYEVNYEKNYLVNISTDPIGAVLSFNGMPIASCNKTPCKAELPEGNIRIVAALEQYETTDTTVSIKQNNQSIAMALKPNFGILDIKPAYSENIGSNEGWSLTINGKEQSSYENRLSPSNYEVKLSHECYEDINFKVGINKGSREVFEMARYLNLKTGGLVLSADKDGSPVSEPVFVNGKQVGETPFSGTVPVCAEVGIGNGKDKVDVKIAYNQTVKHKYQISSGGVSGGVLTDSRDGKKYKVVKIGTQTWMAENLNYNTGGSKCYNNQESNCQKYGRLYNWNTANMACLKGWHLPSDTDWDVLMKSVNPACAPKANCANAGKLLKAKYGWNNNDNGTDTFGFSALPGGYGRSDGSFGNVGNDGRWWSASEYGSHSAYYRYISYYYENMSYYDYDKSYLYSVRCIKDDSGTSSEETSQIPVLESNVKSEKQSGFAVMAQAKKKLEEKSVQDSDAFCEEQRKFAAINFAASRKNKAKEKTLLTEAIAALDKCLAKNPSPEMRKKIEQNKDVLESMKK